MTELHKLKYNKITYVYIKRNTLSEDQLNFMLDNLDFCMARTEMDDLTEDCIAYDIKREVWFTTVSYCLRNDVQVQFNDIFIEEV